MKEQIDHSEERWLVSRRSFLQYATLTGIAVQMPWLSSCGSDEPIGFSTAPYSKDQFRTIQSLMDILFPESGKGPGALKLNADKYLLWVLNDEHFDPEIKEQFIENMAKLDEETAERYSLHFFEMESDDRSALVAELSEITWSRKWFSKLLTLIFEALLLDPCYNVNPNGKGWDWLQHDPGTPRPAEDIQYPQIFAKHEI